MRNGKNAATKENGMQKIQKILCALDLTEFTPEVADYAVAVAKAFDAEILVIHVTPPLTQYAAFEVQPQALELFVDEVSAEAGKTMQEVVAEHFPGVNAKGRVIIGYPSEEIIKTANAEDVDLIIMGTHGRQGVDLIIMGTHGRQGVDLLIFGSVADKVVKNAEMPVITVRPPAEK